MNRSISSGPRVRGRGAPRLAVLGVAVLLGGLVLPMPSAQAAGEAPDYTQTKTLTREHRNADGTTTVVDSRNVTVTVDNTQNLRGRERVLVEWSGARPSAGRAISPYGAGGLNQEYPVVVLQCRGLDDPTLPESQQLQRETCWTSVYLQRYGNTSTSTAVWKHDLHASPADLADPDPATWPEVCPPLVPGILSSRLVPFRAANGTVYPSCNSTTIPPESALDSALPPADLAAFTAQDGTGRIAFEVRTKTENESLGCSSDVPCSLVVIPIMGISCSDSNAECRKSRRIA
ncbi:MAG TPA: hypothetical protein PKB06_09460, partial [Actinotalea sp.]|nr:hypothetical protein [Actinotalea sp.]